MIIEGLKYERARSTSLRQGQIKRRSSILELLGLRQLDLGGCGRMLNDLSTMGDFQTSEKCKEQKGIASNER